MVFEACLRYPERRPMLKSLELRFSHYELDALDRDEIREDVEKEYPPEAFQQFGSQVFRTIRLVRHREEHLRLKDRLREGLRRDKIFHILKDTRLEHLRFNLDECLCDLDCCEMFYNACWTFAPGFARVLPKKLELVEMQGYSEAEMESLKKDWAQLTTFGTLTRMRTAPVEHDMVQQLKGWDFDGFVEHLTDEREDWGETFLIDWQ